MQPERGSPPTLEAQTHPKLLPALAHSLRKLLKAPEEPLAPAWLCEPPCLPASCLLSLCACFTTRSRLSASPPPFPVSPVFQPSCWAQVAFPGSAVPRPGSPERPSPAGLLGLALVTVRSQPPFLCGSWLPVWSQWITGGAGLQHPIILPHVPWLQVG